MYQVVSRPFALPPDRPWMHLGVAIGQVPRDLLDLHNVAELGLCLRGSGWCVIGKRRHRFVAGDGIAIAPGVPHFVHSDRGTLSHWQFLLFDPARLALGEAHEREAIDPSPLAHFLHPADALLRELLAESAARRQGQAAAVRGLCWAVLARLRRLPGQQRHAADPEAIAALRPALERIARGELPPPAVPELAGLCGVSEATLLRRFHAVLGVGPKAWINRARIFRAAERLRDRRVSVLDAALGAGFDSENGFSRQFRAIIGCSPRAWRG
jgi:AraC-like DNA-binding protein